MATKIDNKEIKGERDELLIAIVEKKQKLLREKAELLSGKSKSPKEARKLKKEIARLLTKKRQKEIIENAQKESKITKQE